MVRRTKEEALETRNRILDVAEQVFSQKGVSRTSLADIADAAGVTRGAIYWHFKNKADLFDAMMERVNLPVEEMSAEARVEEIEDPFDKVRHCALAVLERLATDPRCQRVFEISCHKVEYVDELAPLRERHVEGRSECLGQIEHGMREAAKRGLLAEGVSPRFAAIGLHALVDGLITNWVLDPKYLPLLKAARPIVDAYLNGLRRQQSRASAGSADVARTASRSRLKAIRSR